MDNGIVKAKGNEDFTMCKNDIIRHVGEGGMSAKALGVYMVIKYYIDIPNFVLHKDHIQRVSGEGKKAFETVWKELKDLGYIEQERKRIAGKWVYEYTLYRSREEVERNKKATTVCDTVEASKVNQSNNSICHSEQKHTHSVAKIINDNSFVINEKDLPKCEEAFTDLDRLQKAIDKCNSNNWFGYAHLKRVYKNIDNPNSGNGNSNKGNKRPISNHKQSVDANNVSESVEAKKQEQLGKCDGDYSNLGIGGNITKKEMKNAPAVTEYPFI